MPHLLNSKPQISEDFMPAANFKILASLSLLSWLFTSAASAQSNYAAFELVRSENWNEIITEDINGDGRKDLVYSNYSAGAGRELHILLQQENGSFDSNPLRIEIKKEIIAIGFADLREEPGTELLLFAGSGVFSLSANQEGYANNLKLVLEWNLVASVPDLESVEFIRDLKDINKDGYIDLLMPGNNAYGVFYGTENETFRASTVFSTLNPDIGAAPRQRSSGGLDANLGLNAEDGIVVEIALENTTPFSNFVSEHDSADNEAPDSLLRTDNWIANAMVAKLNSDDLLDIFYMNVGSDGLGQINIHFQADDSSFSPNPDWIGSIDSRGELQLADINGDSLIDIVRLSESGGDLDARMYLNAEGTFNFEQPSQVMRFSGYNVNLDFVSLEPESKPILSVNYYTIPVVDAIRNASLNRIQLLYSTEGAENGQLFSRRPLTRLEESFSASNVLGLSEQMSLQYDINGDNRIDALYVTENGSIAAKRINENLTLETDPFWEYVSPRNVFEFEVLPLNQDTSPDLILRHGTTSTVLVARP